jgi:hypothetical protein
MKVGDLSEWIRLGERLLEACPEKFDEILEALEETVGAQEVIAEFDWQLWLRSARPKKRYEA